MDLNFITQQTNILWYYSDLIILKIVGEVWTYYKDTYYEYKILNGNYKAKK
jgi:hypothetical protein